MNRARIQRLERLAAGRTCPRCGQPLRPTSDARGPVPELSAGDARELERLVRGALRSCACGRVVVDVNRLTSDDRGAVLALLRPVFAPG